MFFYNYTYTTPLSTQSATLVSRRAHAIRGAPAVGPLAAVSPPPPKKVPFHHRGCSLKNQSVSPHTSFLPPRGAHPQSPARVAQQSKKTAAAWLATYFLAFLIAAAFAFLATMTLNRSKSFRLARRFLAAFFFAHDVVSRFAMMSASPNADAIAPKWRPSRSPP